MSTSFWGDSGGFLDELDGDYGDGADGQTQVSMSYTAVSLSQIGNLRGCK